MNQKLFEHGIMQDESDYRIHVGFRVGAIYVFPTESGKAAVRSGKYPVKYAGQQGTSLTTSQAIIPSWRELRGVKEIKIPDGLLQAANCKKSESTSIKGKKAVMIVQAMHQMGLIPIRFTITEIKSESMQIKGVDMATKPITLQVKCDFECGDKSKGGTGNLYLETHECNPLGRI